MSTGPRTLCYACKRFRPGFDGPTCAAFPDGIPTQIIEGGFDHRQPFPGDAGQRFVRNPDEPLPPGYPEDADPHEPVFITELPTIRHQTRKELRELAKGLIADLKNHPDRPQ